MKRLLFIIALIPCLVATEAQGKTQLPSGGKSKPKDWKEVRNEARQAVLEEDFNKAISLYSQIIERQKASRQQGTQVDNEIMAEYAYVLALSGAQEAALVNIDLSINLMPPSKEVNFFTGSVLQLIGFEEISQPYFDAGKSPGWLNNKWSELNEKYKLPVLIPIESTATTLQHIKDCIKDTRYIEGLAYSKALTSIDPRSEAAWLLQSAAFEKIGFYNFALQSYSNGLETATDRNLPGMQKQLEYLTKKAEKQGNRISTWQRGQMAYGGLSYLNGNTTITGRYGMYSGPFSYSATINFNISKSGDFSSYYGISGYYNYRKLFVGLDLGFQDYGSLVFTIAPTFGFSFINKKRTSSFDISFGYSIPCASGMKPSLVYSIGKTFYFTSKGSSK